MFFKVTFRCSAQRFFELGAMETTDRKLQWKLRFWTTMCVWMLRDIGATESLLAELTRKQANGELEKLHQLAAEVNRTLYRTSEAEKHVKTLMRLAKKSGNLTVMAEAQLLMGDLMLIEQSTVRGTRSFKSVIKLLGSQKNDLLLARANSGLAACAAQMGKLEEARGAWRQVMNSVKDLPITAASKRLEADLIHCIALSWVDEGRWVVTFVFFLRV